MFPRTFLRFSENRFHRSRGNTSFDERVPYLERTMIRIIIVNDERETNIRVDSVEISLISYANRMQISTFLRPASRVQAGVKFAPNFHQAWDYAWYVWTRIPGRRRQGSWWTIDIWIRGQVSLSRKPFNGRHYRYCIAFEPRSGTPIPPVSTGLQFRGRSA